MVEKIMAKMIEYAKGNKHDIAHFMKVYAYASTIGNLEHLDKDTQFVLEATAIVHDIACPYCRMKYGSANGKLQEKESEALLRPFLQEFELSEKMEERIIFLVCRHHTYEGVDGLDWQILLEADYLVNADEGNASLESICHMRKMIFQTKAGKRLLDSIYLANE